MESESDVEVISIDDGIDCIDTESAQRETSGQRETRNTRSDVREVEATASWRAAGRASPVPEAIDLTAGYYSPMFRQSAFHGDERKQFSSFREEYDDLLDREFDGVFPVEEVAHLLLRHREHWWCR